MVQNVVVKHFVFKRGYRFESCSSFRCPVRMSSE